MGTVLKAAGLPAAYAFEMALNPDTAEYTLTVTERSRTSEGDRYLTQSVTAGTPPDAAALIFDVYTNLITRLHTEGFTVEGDVLV